jgi:hypothetical protein
MTKPIALVVVVLALLAPACSDNNGRGVRESPAGPTLPPPVPATLSIAYRVTGTISNTRITYFSSLTGTTQLTTDLPWTVNYTTSDLHPFLYLAAESPVDNFVDGSLVVQIFVNGVLFREARGGGFTVAVAASGDVP